VCHPARPATRAGEFRAGLSVWSSAVTVSLERRFWVWVGVAAGHAAGCGGYGGWIVAVPVVLMSVLLSLRVVCTKGTYLAAHQAQIRARRGYAKAVGATRHDILVAFYYVVSDRVPSRELGPDWHEQLSKLRSRRHGP